MRIRQPDGFINERSHDAGEPSGTAGRPILAPLEGENLINVVVGVIRYFGGVKLGTGGLTRAYGNAAKMAIEQAVFQPWVEMTEFKMEIEYSELQSLEYQLKKCHGEIRKLVRISHFIWWKSNWRFLVYIFDIYIYIYMTYDI